jgi:transposase
VLGLSRRLRVFVHAGPVDMRKSFYSLGALVAATGHDLVAGDVFVFLGRSRRLCKCLWFDGTGIVLLAKRLEKDRFARVWDRAADGKTAELTSSELMIFLDGSAEVGRRALVPPAFSLEEHGNVAGPLFSDST